MLHTITTPVRKVAFDLRARTMMHRRGWTKLHMASSIGDEKRAAALIAAGANVDARDKAGLTPLYWAVLEGQEGTAKALIAAGADVDMLVDMALDEDGEKETTTFTPLLCAILENQEGIAKALIDAGSDLYGRVGTEQYTPQSLVAAGAEVDARDEFGLTPLLYVSNMENREQIVKCLIKAGADLEATCERYNGTALCHAADDGREDIVRALIRAGADLNAKKDNGDTPLHLAIRSGHEAVAWNLIAAGADLLARGSDRLRLTPLHLLVDSGENAEHKLLKWSEETVQNQESIFVFCCGALVSERHIDGTCPLQCFNGFPGLREEIANMVGVRQGRDLELLKRLPAVLRSSLARRRGQRQGFQFFIERPPF